MKACRVGSRFLSVKPLAQRPACGLQPHELPCQPCADGSCAQSRRRPRTRLRSLCLDSPRWVPCQGWSAESGSICAMSAPPARPASSHGSVEGHGDVRPLPGDSRDASRRDHPIRRLRILQPGWRPDLRYLLVAAAVAELAAILLPFAPVVGERPVVSWPQTPQAPKSTTLLLSNGTPESIA